MTGGTAAEAHQAARGAVGLALVAILAWGGQLWLLRPVVVEADGEVHSAVVLARDPRSAASQAGVRLRPGDEVRVLEGAGSGHLQVVRAFDVEVAADGQMQRYRSTGGSVAQALQALGLELGPLDYAVPEPNTPLRPGLGVRIVRVREEVQVWRETVSFKTVRWAEPRWERGKTGLLREGREGLVEHTDRVRYEDGRAVARTRLSSRVLVEKVDRIVGVGTRVVWRTLSTPLGPVRYRDRRAMVATAYYPGPESTGRYADGLTATGMPAGHGVVAVDPRVIPLGTRLYIPGYGFAVAGDVGSAIRGNRIDLGFNTLQEALHFGRRTVTVYVLD